MTKQTNNKCQYQNITIPLQETYYFRNIQVNQKSYLLEKRFSYFSDKAVLSQQTSSCLDYLFENLLQAKDNRLIA